MVLGQEPEKIEYPTVHSIELVGDSGYYSRMAGWYDADKTQKAFEMNFMGSRQSGVTRIYREDGTLEKRAIFGNGVLHGEITHYDRQGKITLKGKYKEGIKHGFWSYKLEDCYGKYKKGLKVKKWKCGCASGECKVTKYRKGQPLTPKVKKNPPTKQAGKS